MISIFEGELEKFKDAIRAMDSNRIYSLYDEAKQLKDSMPKKRKGILGPMIEFVVFIQDKPGTIAEIAEILGKESINIKDIEVLHVRENEDGSVRVGVISESACCKRKYIWRTFVYCSCTVYKC